MHQKTVETLHNLRNVDWFRNVGVRTTCSANVLFSWKEALDSCKSPEWEKICLEAANDYRESIMRKDINAFYKWNSLVASIKPEVELLVLEKTKNVILKNNLDVCFRSSVNWDILHLCMETELSDVRPPSFYFSQGQWYIEGHFPCGWDGTSLNNGRPVIY